MLQLHRAERADRLVRALAGVLVDPLDDPFTAEVVAVPTRGVERWLSQRLSAVLGAAPGRRDGVCANVVFPFPGRLVGGALAAACGVESDADPWQPERSVWALLDVIEDCLAQDWLAGLAAHLGTDPGADGADHAHRRARRFAAARHLADLFDRYAVHRPAMLRAWAQGRGVDHAGGPLADDVAWQARLWAALRARLGVPSPAERLVDACERIRDQPELLDLPGRLSLFGLTRLPVSYLDVLRAVAGSRDVHLLLLHPSAALWERVGRAVPARTANLPRREDPTAALVRNPLLASWGRDAREMQLVLATGDERADLHHPGAGGPGTLLARLQADVRHDRRPPGPPLPGDADRRAPLEPDDRSVAVHACHGRARQVEVARDAVLHMLADDHTLEPRDIVVMCPDIDAFAPLVHATFGAGEHDDDGHDLPSDARPPDLRVRLADRSLRLTNPVLGVVARLLELPGARLTASQVVDLAGAEPVRRRFGFDDDELARIEEWVAATGIRWGLDAAHRAPFQLDRLEANTWRAGLDRILLGAAMSEDELRLVGGVLPLDDVDSGDIDLAGRLAELIDRLHATVAVLSERRPVAGWVEALALAADALTATGERDAWQRAQLQRLLDDVAAEATVGGRRSDQPLEAAEVEALLGDRLRGRPTRANFRTGHLTMCTLVPMRSVPHRVVCLLGLDDGVFPRRTAADGDDLLARDPCVGDRDPRSEDRQLLLDALLAATERLVITYSGRDERTNATRPPAVPVGELLDVVDRTVRLPAAGADGAPRDAREQVVVEHPLQPFDVRNFTVGALVRGRPWSFDTVALDGARAGSGQRSPPAGFLTGRLSSVTRELVELDDLVAFVRHPVRAFLRQRLGIVAAGDDPEPDDALPVTLGPLERWAVGQRLVDALLGGVELAACRDAELARGVLPPGALGAPILDQVASVARHIVTSAAAEVDARAAPGSVDVHVELGDGRTLVGTVPDVVGERLRAVSYSRVSAQQRLTAWVRLLALTAAHPGRPFEAVTVGRGRRGRVACARIPALEERPAPRARAALAELAVLVDLHDRGLREPLPLFCRTSAAWAAARADGRDPVACARAEWTSGWREEAYWSREDAEREHQLVRGGVVAFDELLAEAPRADEHGPGWHAGTEPSRFGRYARRLWSGPLARERVEWR